jgi:hypothetical protein
MNQAAYIKKVLKAQRPSRGAAGLAQLVRESSGVGADLFRHALVLIGVGGLVAIAVGATTDCQIYERTLNWVSSCFW